jgi:predicted dienelactone hydrolase
LSPLVARVLLAVLLLGVTACGDDGPPPTVTAPPGSYGLGFVSSNVTGDGGERIPVTVTYPSQLAYGTPARPAAPAAAARGPFPLVVFVHGAGASPQTYQRLIEDVASRGYVVAAPTFPESSSPDIVGSNRAVTLAEPQARSLPAIVDRVREAGIGGIPVASLLTDDLHFVGHSLGAATVLTAAYNTCCRMSGVTSVSALSPLLLETSGTYEVEGSPVLLIHGSADDVLPVASAEAIYEDAGPPKYFLELRDAGHFDYVQPNSPFFGTVVLAVTTMLDGYSDGGEPPAGAMEHVAAASDALRLRAEP